MPSGLRTCLIHHIDEGLRVVPKEATDCVTLVLTREYHFDQGRELVQSESASDQTSTAWDIKVRRGGIINTLYKICEGRAEGAPLSGMVRIEVMAVV